MPLMMLKVPAVFGCLYHIPMFCCLNHVKHHVKPRSCRMPQLLMIKQSQTIFTANLCLLNHINHVKPYQVPHMKPYFFRGFPQYFQPLTSGPWLPPLNV